MSQDRDPVLGGTRFGGYQPIGEHPPTRPRSSPLERDAWLASLAKGG